MKKVLVFLGLMLMFAIGYSTPIDEVKDTFLKLTEPVHVIKMDVIDQLNQVRSELNLPEVSYQYNLTDGAQLWSAELSKEFKHDNLRSTGKFEGEVILQYDGDLNHEKIINEFLNSPPHKVILLNKEYKNVGVGISRIKETNYVVLRFSRTNQIVK